MTYVPGLPGTIDVDNPTVKPGFYGASMGRLNMPMKPIDTFISLLILAAIVTTGIVSVFKIKTDSFRGKLVLIAIIAGICTINLGAFFFMSVVPA